MSTSTRPLFLFGVTFIFTVAIGFLQYFNSNITYSQEQHRAPVNTPQQPHLQTDVSPKEQPEVRVVVAVLTCFKNRKKTDAIIKTWGKRVKVVFFASKPHKDFVPPDNLKFKMPKDTVYLDVPEGRSNLSEKTSEAFRYLYKNYKNKADWFMKADDDTYVIVENLRLFLSKQNSSEPVLFGHKFTPHVQQGYMAGGAGYVLSREALSRLHKDMSSAQPICKWWGCCEDVDLAQCMANIGVSANDTGDLLGQSRFNPFDPTRILLGPMPEWLPMFDKQIQDGYAGIGPDYMSSKSITFHYMEPKDMFLIDFYLYKLRVHRK